MKRGLTLAGAAIALGASIGLLIAARWESAISGSGSIDVTRSTHLITDPMVLGLAEFLLFVTLLVFLCRALQAGIRAQVLGLGAVVMGTAAYLFLTSARPAVFAAYPISRVLAPLGALALAVGLLAAGRRRAWVGALLVAAALSPLLRFQHLAMLDGLARESLRYGPMPSLGDLVSVVAGAAILGGLCGAFRGGLLREDGNRSATAGLLVGTCVGTTIAATGAVLQAVAMGSGQNPASIAAAAIVTPVALLVAFTLPWATWGSSRWGLVARFAPVAGLLAAGEYVFIAAYGYADFATLRQLGPDQTYAYVHFTGGESWRRTVDSSGSRMKADRAGEFVNTYPRSAYRPAALLLEAENRFDLWQFRIAGRILARFERDYPHLNGYPRILRSIADLAAGRPETMLRRIPENTRFAMWRGSAGAQLAATAAERAGQSMRACGFYSAYLDYLERRPVSYWTAQSVEFTEARVESLMRDSAAVTPLRGSVSGRILAGGRPVEGVRIVLVRPRHDGALPRDSATFTGAWTVPAWGGIWSVSDRNGRFVVRGVPHGIHEVVIGVPMTARTRCLVVAPAIAPVVLGGSLRRVRLPDIELRPRVTTVSPAVGEVVAPQPILRWRAYPGARSYAVSVMSLGGGPKGRQLRRPGRTVWARSGIRDSQVRLGTGYFVNGHVSLEPGASYAWVVHAYCGRGGLLSTSEHYFDIREASFVEPKAQKGDSIR